MSPKIVVKHREYGSGVLIFKLGKYYFPSCSGEAISLHHSFTPSLPVRHLKPRGELPYEKVRDARCKI